MKPGFEVYSLENMHQKLSVLGGVEVGIYLEGNGG